MKVRKKIIKKARFMSDTLGKNVTGSFINDRFSWATEVYSSVIDNVSTRLAAGNNSVAPQSQSFLGAGVGMGWSVVWAAVPSGCVAREGFGSELTC